MEVTRIIINGGASFRWSFGPHYAWCSIESTTILTTHPSLDGDGFDSKDDYEFMHSFTCRAQLRYLMANAYNHQILQLVLKNSNSSFMKKNTTKYRKLEH